MASIQDFLNKAGTFTGNLTGNVTGDLTGTADTSKEVDVIATTEASNAKVDGTTTATEVRSISQADYDDLSDAEKADILWLVTS